MRRCIDLARLAPIVYALRASPTDLPSRGQSPSRRLAVSGAPLTGKEIEGNIPAVSDAQAVRIARPARRMFLRFRRAQFRHPLHGINVSASQNARIAPQAGWGEERRLPGGSVPQEEGAGAVLRGRKLRGDIM